MTAEAPSPRNRAERRTAGKKMRAAGAALTAGGAALAMGAAWIGTGIESANAAATRHVTSTADDGGSGTLRSQIAAADPGDTIVFDVTGTITLLTGEIFFSKDLTITGPGASLVTVSGNNQDRIFDIAGGSTVTISGLTLTEGSPIAGDGGAIFVAGCGGSLTLDDDVISNSSAPTGGGVFSFDTLNLSNTTVTGNHASGDGGGVAMYVACSPGNFSAVNSTFTGNTAGGDGGGIGLEIVGDASIIDTTITGSNTAGGDGGGFLFYDGGTLTVTGSTISGNTAGGDGGGGYVSTTVGTNAVTNSTFSGNQAGGYGGGLAFDDIYGVVSLQGVTITGANTAGGNGGGLWTEDTYLGLQIDGSTISGNTAANRGGGLYASGTYAFVNVSNTTIADNTAFTGGGVAVSDQYNDSSNPSPITVLDTTISGNHATSDAGGATGGGGGWIQWGVPAATTFDNSTISGNTATGEGGGVYFYGFDGLTLNQSTVSANTSERSTGGVFLSQEFTPAAKSAKAGDDTHAAKTGVNAMGQPRVRSQRAHTHGANASARRAHAAQNSGEATSVGTILSGSSGLDVGGSGTLVTDHSLLGPISTIVFLTDQGGNLFGVDPMLGPLANNGGPTQTMALLTGSPAIDAGPVPVPSFVGNEFDQRGAGFPRILAGTVDIGAFEAQAAVPIDIAPKFTG